MKSNNNNLLLLLFSDVVAVNSCNINIFRKNVYYYFIAIKNKKI